MGYLLRYFIKRIPREGWKSLSVPALALVLVFLINMLGGIRIQMESEYEYVMDHHPIYFKLSDGDGTATDGLMITEQYLSQFTEPDSLWSLYDYVDSVLLKRELYIVGEQAPQIGIEMIGVSDPWSVVYFGDESVFVTELINSNRYAAKWSIELEELGVPPYPETGADINIEIFQGYSEDLYEFYMQYGSACLVTDDILEHVSNGILRLDIITHAGRYERVRTHYLNIAGVIRGPVSGKVFCDYALANTIFAPTGYMEFYVVNMPSGSSLSIRPPIEMFISQDLPVIGSLIGITMPEDHESFLPDTIANAVFFDGYDKTAFSTNEYVCVVTEDAMQWVHNGVVYLDAQSKADIGAEPVGVELKVIGTAPGDGSNAVFIPFKTVSEIGRQSDGQQLYSERLRATISDNRRLVDFKHTALRTFYNVGIYFNPRVSSMTIFDAEFYDLTETLQQTIFFIDIVTPFVYAIAVCVGFVASFLLTRRRMSEFAVMRSIGVNKESIFVVTLFEQALLCAAGVVVGCVIFALTWDLVFIMRPAVFFACYISGAVLSAARAAGTDVLRLLRDKG